MSRGPDAATQLERALLAMADGAGCPIEIGHAKMTPWASATFVGARHVLGLDAAASPLLDAWLATLAEAEFTLRGHLVADVHVASTSRDGGRVRVSLEALTIEDA